MYEDDEDHIDPIESQEPSINAGNENPYEAQFEGKEKLTEQEEAKRKHEDRLLEIFTRSSNKSKPKEMGEFSFVICNLPPDTGA